MATRIESREPALIAERRFFFALAVAMATVIVSGFALNMALGRSSFALPPIFHVHAFFFFGWVALYLVQNILVVRGETAVHRRAGQLSLIFIPAMTVLGITMTLFVVRTSGGPFFFDQNAFLFGNVLGILGFAGVATSGILKRRDADWHRRLMSGAMAMLTGPGFGRLLPLPLFVPWAWWVAVLTPLVFPLAGAFYDLRRRGRVHTAWFWVMGTLLALHFIAESIAYSHFGVALTETVVSGMPGSARPMHAFMP